MTNVLLFLADDLGYSDLGCYGSEIVTPHLDRLAEEGVRLTQFYNTARCSPSRASLLTGLHPHQTGIGILTNDDGPRGYPGSLVPGCATTAEILGAAGFDTALFGKWHLSSSPWEPDASWPTRRGFQTFWGTLSGCGSYFNPSTLHDGERPVPPEELGGDFHYTDAITDAACAWLSERGEEEPFFGYVAYTAPHWPLHAREEDVETYRGVYDEGWDVLRERRMDRLRASGLLGAETTLSDRDPSQPAWDDVTEKAWEARRMEVYAAQVEAMDRGIGRVLAALETSGKAEDTIVVFLSDNGASAEEVPQGDPESFRARRGMIPETTADGGRFLLGNSPDVVPGPENTYASYGQAWANLSNVPFRFYKRWVHEGGIATPFVVRWPAGGLRAGSVVTTPFQLTNVLPTLLEATGAQYPPPEHPAPVPELEGRSMLAAWRGEPAEPQVLAWEHIGNAAVREGSWKLVREYPGPWELYDVEVDRAERHDVAAAHPDVVARLESRWQEWADRVGVVPRGQIVELYTELAAQGVQVQGAAELTASTS